MIDEATEEIADACPEVTYDTLENDTEVVQASLPAIQYVFSKRGFNTLEAVKATIYGWEQLRIKQLKATAELSPKELINYVTGFGQLIITTSPSGASIQIDGSVRTNKTEDVEWATPGTYRLRLSLDGYESIESECAVEEGKPTHFERTLKPIKKKN